MLIKLLLQKKYKDFNGVIHPIKGNEKFIYNPSVAEINTAIFLKENLGGKLIMILRIGAIKGNKEKISINTPDYIFRNERWDLKNVKGTGKWCIDGSISNCKYQSRNFIIDISNSELSYKVADEQINNIYLSKHRLWLNKIILIKNSNILKIYQRKNEEFAEPKGS